MKTTHAVRLATSRDAPGIAGLSRDEVEHDLIWRYRPERIVALLRAAEVNVVVVDGPRQLTGVAIAGFGIMEYRQDSAHLVLLAVHPRARRQGIARRLVGWLEQVALDAGLRQVSVECRWHSSAARGFYAALGYREVARLPGYYDRIEDGLRLSRTIGAPL